MDANSKFWVVNMGAKSRVWEVRMAKVCKC